MDRRIQIEKGRHKGADISIEVDTNYKSYKAVLSVFPSLI